MGSTLHFLQRPWEIFKGFIKFEKIYHLNVYLNNFKSNLKSKTAALIDSLGLIGLTELIYLLNNN